ncbi:hypothetical protein BP5796_06928 [Coleophoma crateriformis]|uniref:FAD protein n=1 Tax=Coleophoma crateriformis TaxID=565419 RepID=A0A3D8RPV4_9HELO|nr:hypothetical protein BP5796_06928 [Coleophoma crateriformis]
MTPSSTKDDTTELSLDGTPNSYQHSKDYIGKPRPIRVILIGCGISGIGAAKLFREKFSGKPVELVIYERQKDVGGTWLQNRHPGCACDVLSHIYAYSWESNPKWSRAYVESPEIWEYFEGRSIAYGVDEFLKLSHKVVGATWQAEKGKWKVGVENTVNGETFFDEAEVLINAGGYLSSWVWPQIPGLESFKGHMTHSAHWDDKYVYNETKTVAVIGSGSSAIQIVPQLQKKVKHLTSFNRSPIWITPEWNAQFAKDGRGTTFSKEQRDHWSSHPEEFFAYRQEVEVDLNNIVDLLYKDTDVQKDARLQAAEDMKKKLEAKEGLAEKLVPDFVVGCRRVTPGTGYLEALAAENVTVQLDQISEIYEEGIKMEDGTLIKVDSIVCATGFDSSYKPAFPVIGLEGKDLREEWKDEPRSYLSIAAANFPNYFIIAGPNFTISNGGLHCNLEVCINYTYKAVEKISKQGIKSMVPKQAAIDDFQEHKDSAMQDMVWTSHCSSWYKNGKTGGKVWGPWCGSSLHFMELMEEPRWEDWDFEYLNRNRFHYLGFRKSSREVLGGDLAYYLKPPTRIAAELQSPEMVQRIDSDKEILSVATVEKPS